MPALKNAKHEAFAQGLFKGLTVDKAYAEAGFRAHRSNASRLSAKDSIRERVAELQARASEKAEWSAADRLSSLKAIHDAQTEKDPRVAISAISEANKMQGSHAPARHQHSGPNGGPIPYTDMTEEEIDARLAALAAGAGKSDA